MLSPEQQHQRFSQQANWTRSIRAYVYKQINLQHAGRVLEVGCGDGAVLEDLQRQFACAVHGLDIRVAALKFARQIDPGRMALTCGDAANLPYQNGLFDTVFCHFTLLWLQEPLAALKEMRRVTRPGGWVAALAEPDYGGRIDFPEALVEMGNLQGRALLHMGADPNLGRKLSGLMHGSGLKEVQVGVLGGQWGMAPSEAEQAGEWQALEDDLEGWISRTKMAELRRIDAEAWQKGERILFVPTFYGWGRVD